MLKAIRALWDLLFPITCIGCGKDNTLICSSCLAQIKTPHIQGCPGCGKAAELGEYCKGCGAGKPLDGLLTAFLYEKGGCLARMLHQYKYEGITCYGQKLSELLAGRVTADLARLILGRMDLITWVPLSPQKQRRRGFNQTEKLAAGILLPIPRSALLSKIRENRSQMQLSRRERLINVKGSFKINMEYAELVTGKNILIVDDVATTLATLSEMAEILKSAGANSVYGLVLARQQE